MVGQRAALPADEVAPRRKFSALLLPSLLGDGLVRLPPSLTHIDEVLLCLYKNVRASGWDRRNGRPRIPLRRSMRLAHGCHAVKGSGDWRTTDLLRDPPTSGLLSCWFSPPPSFPVHHTPPNFQNYTFIIQ